ncbi:uncharacterized protein LOC122501190 [Leptopilina heterotoma]|uniref:uncharacterized protein LOC122501190 n=1 Tax=Leptopilina heterotoma TaxID=63436 RepID=UPI001CA9207B|nr:uncharacterized protein LOC122501190 [Leptopilina heterotoma]
MIQVRNNLEQISQIISIAELPLVVVLTKMIIIYYNKKKITILYSRMIDHWDKDRNTEEIEIMRRTGDKGRKIALLCISLGNASVIVSSIQWFFENLSDWKTSGHFKNYTLYVEAYYPFTWNYSPIFEITSLIELIGIFLATVAYIGVDGFFCQVVLHLSGEYNVLRVQLLNLVNNFNVTIFDNEFDEKFGYIVDVHDHINSSLSSTERLR